MILLYAIGAASFPTSILYKIFGENRAAVCFSAFLARAVCCAVPVWLLFEIKAKKLFSGKGFLKGLLVVLPFYVVAINNFPFLPMIFGNASIVFGEPEEFVLSVCCYALMCIAISFLEETVFRGAIFVTLLRKFCKQDQTERERKKGEFLSIIISAALFGGAHLVNFFAGANIGSTLLQVGYSFLIGCMCAVAMLKSGNFYHAVVLHAVFDFGGLLLDKGMISGAIWTTENMILTAAVGVIVAAYAVIVFVKGKNSAFVGDILINDVSGEFTTKELTTEELVIKEPTAEESTKKESDAGESATEESTKLG